MFRFLLSARLTKILKHRRSVGARKISKFGYRVLTLSNNTEIFQTQVGFLLQLVVKLGMARASEVVRLGANLKIL